MYVAELLSRNYLNRSDFGDEVLLDVIHTVSEVMVSFKISKKQEFIRETQNYEVLGKVLKYCEIG